jgi:hypothetical protein
MRDNVQAVGPEEYFRKSIPPFLDYTLNEIKTRFTDLHTRTALGLQFIPSIVENITEPHPPLPVKRVSGSAPDYIKTTTQYMLNFKPKIQMHSVL